jgi:glycosyltransferase involved in cell wall biosynthesis
MKVLMICPELPSADKPGSMAPTTRQIQSLIDLGLSVQTIDMRGMPKLKYVQAIPRVCRALRSVDLVHAHFGYCGWLALLGRRLAARRVPIVMSFMGDDLLGTPADETGRMERSSLWAVRFNCRVARSYAQIIVKSSEMARRLAPRPCHVIPNGVDLNRFLPRNRGQARSDLQTGEKFCSPETPVIRGKVLSWPRPVSRWPKSTWASGSRS